MKNLINKREVIIISLTLIISLALGWFFFHSSDSHSQHDKHEHNEHQHDDEQSTIWTCSMHPQIKQDKPGLCPICAMDLIPMSTEQSDDMDVSPNEIQISQSAIKLADIQTISVKRGTPEKTLHLLGKVEADERNIAELTARFPGRIEKLYISFTGQNVRKGEKLAQIYSPELITAQKELFEAMKFKESNPSFYIATKNKLRFWNLSDEQISEIEQNKEPKHFFDILSPISGTVTQRHISLGNYVKEGSPLFQVVDLSRVWVLFDVYENDLSWLKLGAPIEFTIQSIPGKSFKSNITFIDPVINPQTRVAKIRTEISNNAFALKPEMFANGTLHSKIPSRTQDLLIPKSSVLWTGKRAIVYVKVPDRETPSFLFREIKLGANTGDFYVVADGLSEGEEIVVNGVFKVDAAAQLVGKPSMMNPEGGLVLAGHQHDMTSMQTNEQKEHEHKEQKEQSMEQHSKLDTEHTSFKVAGNCGMCKSRIEKAAKSLDGVLTANWSEKTKMLHLDYDKNKVNLDKIHKTIANAGHDTEKEKAPDDVYNKLPGCCLYERIK